MSDQPTTLYPDGTIARLVYVERKCCDCNDKPVNWSGDNLRCQACCVAYYDREQGKHWADHVLRRVKSDPEFRERLRAALGGDAVIGHDPRQPTSQPPLAPSSPL